MKKGLKIASAVAGALVLLIVAVFLYLADMLLDHRPETAQEPLTKQDFEIQNRILGQIFRSITSRKAPEVVELKLTPADFQSVIRCADRLPRQQEIPLRDYQPALAPGKFRLTVPYNTKQNWLFGGWIIGRFELKLHKESEKLSVQVLSAEAGKFKIANETAQKMLDEQLDKLRRHPNYEKFDKIVESISIDSNGNMTIRYRPRNAVFLLNRRR